MLTIGIATYASVIKNGFFSGRVPLSLRSLLQLEDFPLKHSGYYKLLHFVCTVLQFQPKYLGPI